MDNNAVDEITGMGYAEETAILDATENYIATSTFFTTVYMDTIVVDVKNTRVRVEITGVGIDTPGVQDKSHE